MNQLNINDKLLNIKLESEKSDRSLWPQNITISLERIKEFCHGKLQNLADLVRY